MPMIDVYAIRACEERFHRPRRLIRALLSPSVKRLPESSSDLIERLFRSVASCLKLFWPSSRFCHPSVRALQWRDVALRRIGGFEEAGLAIYRSDSTATKETFALTRLTVNPLGTSLTHW